ncbi:MAG TPA: hypothetical protein VMZ91_06410 [Candidatus Paceibacterota bacterium]|nr:hypothetical protein [Candidatus Paceibacterota bacterium]
MKLSQLTKNSRLFPSLYLQREKLTKLLLMSLPEGYYIVSNCYQQVNLYEYIPAFEGTISSLPTRVFQWEHIKNNNADNRLCCIYTSKEVYDQEVYE